MNWSEPLNLAHLRVRLERDPKMFESSPGNLSIIGVISGYRTKQTDPSFREVYFEISQGYNDELRLVYIGKYLRFQQFIDFKVS